jgi:dolichol kinase
MIFGLLSLVAIYFLIRFAENLRREHHLKPEVTRKFVHMSVGSYVAFWPFFMPDWAIYFICFGFISVVMASRLLGWFKSIHAVDRKTWGDILFPIGIASTLLVANNKWVFAIAMLHLALADGVAALVGEKWGQKTVYKINGYKKTIVGNGAFFATSALIMIIAIFGLDVGFSQLGLAGVFWIPLVATALETVAVRGLDNLIVPVTLAIILNMLQVLG